MSWLFLSVTLIFMFAGLALSFWSASKALESKRIASEGVPVTAEIVRVEEEERHINRDDGPRIQIVYFEVAALTTPNRSLKRAGSANSNRASSAPSSDSLCRSLRLFSPSVPFRRFFRAVDAVRLKGKA